MVDASISPSDLVFYNPAGLCDDRYTVCSTFVGLLWIPRHKVLSKVTTANSGQQRSTAVNDIEAKTKDLESDIQVVCMYMLCM